MKLPWPRTQKPRLEDVIVLGEKILAELERLSEHIDTKEQEINDARPD